MSALVELSSDFTSLCDSAGLLLGPAFGPVFSDILTDSVVARYGTALHFLYDVLHKPCNIPIPDGAASGVVYPAHFVPGHTGFNPLDRNSSVPLRHNQIRYGPKRGCAEIVVVGKHPGAVEQSNDVLFSGESGRELLRALCDVKLDLFLDNAYFTNVCRFLPPRGKATKASWIKECWWLLWAELVIIRPKIIILLGTEAIKRFHGPGSSVSKTRGFLLPWETNLGDDKIVLNTFGTMHPAAVARESSLRPGLSADLSRCHSFVTNKKRKVIKRYYDEDGPHLRTVSQVKEWVDRLLDEGRVKFALDCEWAGRSPYSGDGKLLTVQISWGIGRAVLIVIHRHLRADSSSVAPDGWALSRLLKLVSVNKPAPSESIARDLHYVSDRAELVGYVEDNNSFYDSADAVEILDVLVPNFSAAELQEVVGHLKRLLERPNVRVGGHHFRSDEPWLSMLGLDLSHQFHNGFDTVLKHHLLAESVPQDLTSVMRKYTDLDPYDADVQKYISALKLTPNQGFGRIPEKVLYLYALRDADVTFCADEGLDAEYENNEKEARSELKLLAQSELNACMGILEIEKTGILIDQKRLMSLADSYTRKRTELVDELKRGINWPDFNYRSILQTREFLFGEEFNGASRNATGSIRRLRPPGAHCCDLTPVKTTSKPAVGWNTVVSRGMVAESSPSTDKETLGILSATNEYADTLRKIRFVDQVCKNFTGKIVDDDNTGKPKLEAGLAQHLDKDGRIRTHILQLTETGRWASRKPNCFSGDTEILTDGGWLAISSLVRVSRDTVKVAQYTLESERIEFVHPTAYYTADKRPLLSISTEHGQFDLAVTPDHRCLLKHRKTGAYRVVTAKKYSTDFHQLNAGIYSTDSLKFSASRAFIQFLVMTQADGSWVKGDGVDFCFSKSSKIKRCRDILDSLCINYRESLSGLVTRFHLGERNSVFIAARACLGFCRCFGSWVLDLNRSQLNIFINELWYWGGCLSRRRQYTSNFKINSDWVQIAFCLSNQRARLREYSAASGSVSYRVDVYPRNCSLTTNAIVSQLGESCSVYCLSVPSGFVVTRRNGAVCITGQCQNIPKRRESELQSLFLANDKPPLIRSVFMASPGCVLGEFDYIQAELMVLALLSGDAAFWETLVSRARYPVLVNIDDGTPYRWLHPDWVRDFDDICVGDRLNKGTCWGKYKDETGEWHMFSTGVDTVVELREWPRDLHAERAISGFRMPYCAVIHGPPKNYVNSVDKGKRVASKTINFGIPYGRSAGAIARELRQDGVSVDVSECQTMINGFADDFKLVDQFLSKCRWLVAARGYMRNVFGRYRRFSEFVESPDKLASQQREASNFPIQSVVAECLNMAVYNCWHYRSALKSKGISLDFKIVLGVHDALLLEIAGPSVPYMLAEGGFVDFCMSDRARIPIPNSAWCDGLYKHARHDLFPFALGVDKDIMVRWDEKPAKEDLLSRGVPASCF